MSSSRRLVPLFIQDIHQAGASQKTKRNYIDDALSLSNSKHLLIELEINDIAYTASRTASYIDLHIEIDSECRRLRTKRDYKRGSFNFPIVKFIFIFSNIPATALCGVYISQFVRYSRTCGSDYAFLDREFLLTRNILKQ